MTDQPGSPESTGGSPVEGGPGQEDLHLPSDVTANLLKQQIDKFMAPLRVITLHLCGVPVNEIRPALQPIIHETEVQAAEEERLQLDQTPRQTSAPPACTHTPTRPANQFRKKGDYWTIVYEGKEIQLQDLKGCIYIKLLLQDPNREFLALHLSMQANGGLPEPNETYSEMSKAQREEEGLSSTGSADTGPIMDKAYKDDVRRKLAELDASIDLAEARGDYQAVRRLKEERSQYVYALGRDIDRGGRCLTGGNTKERSRVAVTAAIKRVLTRIKNDHPSLYEHLSASIYTGEKCCYSPSANTHWTV